MEVEARDGRSGVHVQLPGHAVQVGQPEVDTAHRQHAGLKQVDVTVVVPGNLKGADRDDMHTFDFTFPMKLLDLY